MMRPEASGSRFLCPAQTFTINHSNQLSASRILAPNQNNNLRVGGNTSTKLSVSCILTNQTAGSDTFNASTMFDYMTGDTSTDITVGDKVFSGCYLDSAQIDIAPFAPVTASAEFTCTNPPKDVPFVASNAPLNAQLTSGIAYGHFTVLSGGSGYTDANRGNISYRVNCQRTYQYAIGQTIATNIFLDGVEKEINIKATNINNFINQSGFGESFTISPRNAANESILTLSITSAAKIVSQNLSMPDSDILSADVSIKEVVL